MEDILLEFLRRFANTITPKLISDTDYLPATAPLLDTPLSLGSLARDDYFYVSTQTLPLTEQSFTYTPLGLSFLNDSLIISDSLLFSEEVQQSYSIQRMGQDILVWVFSDSSGFRVVVPVRDDYYGLVKRYLPHFRWWRKTEHGESYPIREYYLEGDLRNWSEVYELLVDDIAHPYAKGVYLTGYAILQGDGVVNYEYIDREGYFGEPGLCYISSLRPPQIDFPLGRPKPGDLVRDLCVASEGWYPGSGNESWVGKYTGYRSTPGYHPLITYYLYQREDGSVFLWEGRPHQEAWLWVGNALGYGGLGVGVEWGEDYVYQQEYSCGVTLLLEDASLIPARYDYPFPQDVIGDCSTLDDIFVLKGGRRAYRYVDDLFPVADLLTFTDMP